MCDASFKRPDPRTRISLKAAAGLAKCLIAAALAFGNLAAPAPASAQGTCWDVRIQGHTTCDFSSSGSGGGNYQFNSANWDVFFDNLGNFLEKIFGRSHSRPPAHVRRANAFLEKAIEFRDGGDYASSIDYFKKARGANPKGSTDWIDANIAWNQGRLAFALWDQEDYVGAFEYLGAAAQYDPQGYGQDLAEIRRWAEIQQSMRDQSREGRRIVRQALREKSAGSSYGNESTYDFNVTKANLLAELKRSGDVVEGGDDEVDRDFFRIEGSPREDLEIELLGDGDRARQIDEDDLITEPLRQAEAAKDQAARADAASKSNLRETALREASKPFDRRASDVAEGTGLPQVTGVSDGSVVDARNIAERPILEGLRDLREWQVAAQRRQALNIERSRQQKKLETLERKYNDERKTMNRSEKGRLQVRIAIQKRATDKVEQQVAAVISEQVRIYDSFASGMYEKGADKQTASPGEKKDAAAPKQN